MPATSAGLPAIENAMYPASTGSIRPNEVTPICNVSLSRFCSAAGSIASMFGPLSDMGANASENAMRMPPAAMNGIV